VSVIGKILSWAPVRERIIKRAMRTPYYHIPGYMGRWWLFNGDKPDGTPKYPWLKRIRIHHILREDEDRPRHDHPADFCTHILKGWYDEEREGQYGELQLLRRNAGDTAKLKFGEFHSIRQVSEGGVWTFFILGRRKGMWGFKVNGKKIPWREYMEKKMRMDYRDK
jgi:hypothetical protein